MVRNTTLPARLLNRALNAVQANGASGSGLRATPQALGQQMQQLEQTRGKAAQAATATRQATPTYTIPVTEIKTDLYGAVSAVTEGDVVQEGVFQVGYVWTLTNPPTELLLAHLGLVSMSEIFLPSNSPGGQTRL
jgi:phosphate/sulfate permease